MWHCVHVHDASISLIILYTICTSLHLQYNNMVAILHIGRYGRYRYLLRILNWDIDIITSGPGACTKSGNHNIP